MAKNRYLLIIILLYCVVFSGSAQRVSLRDKVHQAFTGQIGVREKTGNNDGVMVETYLRYCGLSKGNPWCASFVCWAFGQQAIHNPRSGYCPDLFTKQYVIYQRSNPKRGPLPQPGDIFGLYFPEKHRIAHTGFIETWGDGYVITVEGNTNQAGSREGDGVYRKRRPMSSIYAVANYIDK